MLFQVFLTVALSLIAQGAPAAPNAAPFSTAAGLAIVQNPVGNGDSRIFFQAGSGAIAEYAVVGTFDTGVTNSSSPVNIVPIGSALMKTPLTAAVLGPSFTEIHLFFLSPNFILSEYYWSPVTRFWRGGRSCPECIDNALQLQVSRTTTTLSTTIDSVNDVLSIVFVAQGNATTLTQAIRRNGNWTTALLPDASTPPESEESSAF